jgi:hypothetical protein
MGAAKENLARIIGKVNQNEKARAVFVTNISGKDINWDMTFQFNLENEDPFYLSITNRKGILSEGTKSDAEIIMAGDPEAIIRISNGKGDFTHAISREQITMVQGKVMDVVRLTRAITIALKGK